MASEDETCHVRLVQAEMGLGKTGAALKFAARMLRRDFGHGTAPVREGGRKPGAVYWFAPTIRLAVEIAERARQIEGLRPYVLRGRGQPNPGSSSESPGKMCAKEQVLIVQETAGDDGSATMCGPRRNRCSAYIGCAWVEQVEDLLTCRANLVILTHASVTSAPPGGERLPEPIAIIVDEEPVLSGGILAVTRRFFEETVSNGPTADDLDRVADLVEERVLNPLQAEEGILQQRVEAWPSARACERPMLDPQKMDAIVASGELRGVRRGLDQAGAAMLALRNLAAWLRSKREEQLITRAEIEVCCPEAHHVAPALKKAFRPVLAPNDWERTPVIDAAAENAHLLRQVDDLFERVIIPFLRAGQKHAEAFLPGADVEVGEARTPDAKKVGVPRLTFAWLRPLLKRWQKLPTLLLDGTGDPLIYERIWPELQATPLIGAPWVGRAFWVIDRGFGKSALVSSGKDSEGQPSLTRRGEEVRTLVRFVARYSGGRTSLITHLVTEELLSDDTENLEVNHHGAIRGLDDMRGVKAHLVVSRHMPPVKACERAAEALFGRPVARLKPREGKATADWIMEPVSIAGGAGRIPRHPDEYVSRYVDQIATAGQAQAAHRARPLRDDVDVFILGAELDWINGAAEVTVLEWDELMPQAVDRMLAERGVAFGGQLAAKTFTWLSRTRSGAIAGQIEDGSWLREWAEQKGSQEVRGRARPLGSRGGPATAFVAMLLPGQELDDVLASVELARVATKP